MKILYLHPRAWTGEYPILAKLKELGHEICVLEELRPSDTYKTGIADSFLIPGDGIQTVWFDPRRGWEKLLTWPIDRFFKRAFDGRNLGHRLFIVLAAVYKFRPDVVVCTDGFTYAIPAAFLNRLGLLRTPLVVGYIGGDILDCPEASVGKRRTTMVNWLIRTSLSGISRMRPVCGSLKQILLSDGADANRIHVIPVQLGVDSQILKSIAASRVRLSVQIRQRYGIPPDAPLIVTLSGNQKGKGLHLLAHAWDKIAHQVPGCRWLLCGPDDPWLTKAVWPILQSNGRAMDVVATGRLKGSDVYEHLAAGDVHVNPTICEGLNLVTVEAAAVGTPTVGTDGAGISDWMYKYVSGVVVPAGDIVKLADAIITLLNDSSCRSSMSAAGIRMAEEFALDRISLQLTELFELARRS